MSAICGRPQRTRIAKTVRRLQLGAESHGVNQTEAVAMY
jgi:hypothetical protein